MSSLACFSGHYIYIEATSRNRGDTAVLRSRNTTVPMEIGTMCFVFYYHMYGSDVGELRIVREDENGRTVLFTESGKSLVTKK